MVKQSKHDTLLDLIAELEDKLNEQNNELAKTAKIQADRVAAVEAAFEEDPSDDNATALIDAKHRVALVTGRVQKQIDATVAKIAKAKREATEAELEELDEYLADLTTVVAPIADKLANIAILEEQVKAEIEQAKADLGEVCSRRIRIVEQLGIVRTGDKCSDPEALRRANHLELNYPLIDFPYAISRAKNEIHKERTGETEDERKDRQSYESAKSGYHAGVVAAERVRQYINTPEYRQASVQMKRGAVPQSSNETSKVKTTEPDSVSEERLATKAENSPAVQARKLKSSGAKEPRYDALATDSFGASED